MRRSTSGTYLSRMLSRDICSAMWFKLVVACTEIVGTQMRGRERKGRPESCVQHLCPRARRTFFRTTASSDEASCSYAG